MFKHLLTLSLLGGALCAAADRPQPDIRISDASWKFPKTEKGTLLRHEKAVKNSVAAKRTSRKIADGSYAFTGVTQSFEDPDYNFSLGNGSPSAPYSMSIKVDGTTVTISNMLGVDDPDYGQSSQDIVGTYDAAAHTITIPTLHGSASEATIAGSNYYGDQLALVGGNYDGLDFWPTDELVLTVEGDFESIYTSQDIALISIYGEEMGYLEQSYSAMYALKSDKAGLFSFARDLNLGECYPGNALSAKVAVVNMGTEAVAYAASAPQGVTVEPATGTVGPLSDYTDDYGYFNPPYISLSYTPAAVGEFSQEIPLSWENDSDEGTFTLHLYGEAKAVPDYSAIVKGGEMTFSTGFDLPYQMTEKNGVPTAAPSLTTYGSGTSYLEVSFTVPAGNSGHFTYVGTAKCKEEDNPYGYNYAYIYKDGEEALATSDDTDLNTTLDFEPGDHTVRFAFSTGYSWYNMGAELGLFLTSLELKSEAAAASGVELTKGAVEFGGLLLGDEPVVRTGELTVRNLGNEPLTIASATCDNPAFSAEVPNGTASLMQELPVTVTLTATEPGEYSTTVTIVTSAGTVTGTAHALVRKMPEFSKILTGASEIVTVTTDENHPFILSEDGTFLYNSTAKVTDNEPTTAWVEFKLNVPKGKIAHVSWSGTVSSSEADNMCLNISAGGNFDVRYASGERSIGSADLLTDSYSQGCLECVAGEHTYYFTYNQAGDGAFAGEDRVAFTDFHVDLEDFDETAAELETPEAPFADVVMTDVEHNTEKNFMFVYIKNNGAGELRCLRDEELDEVDLPNSAPFAWFDPGYVVHHGNSLQVRIGFVPQYEGNYEGDLVIPTTFGNFTVHCTGRAYLSDGILMHESIEGTEVTWQVYDADGDNEQWVPMSSVMSYITEAYCHSGSNCAISFSARYGEALNPDNWIISPEVTVPADGAMLDWYVAPYDKEAPAESYEMHIIPAADYDLNNLSGLTPAFSETLTAGDYAWKKGTADLKEYAGQKVRIAFRHNTAEPQSALRLDDVMLFTNDKYGKISTGIRLIDFDSPVVATEYYDLNGVRLASPADGISVKVQRLENGTVISTKVVK